MIKPLITITSVVLVAGTLTLCFAQGAGKRRAAMEEQAMVAMCPMYIMTMESMVAKSIMATGDGGVFVMAGNKLIKYEKDFNFNKETKVKIGVVWHAETDEPNDGAMSYVQEHDTRGSMMGQGSVK